MKINRKPTLAILCFFATSLGCNSSATSPGSGQGREGQPCQCLDGKPGYWAFVGTQYQCQCKPDAPGTDTNAITAGTNAGMNIGTNAEPSTNSTRAGTGATITGGDVATGTGGSVASGAGETAGSQTTVPNNSIDAGQPDGNTAIATPPTGGTIGTTGTGTAGTTETGPPTTGTGNCQGSSMPPVVGDYSKTGPLQTRVINGSGPNGQYTLYVPTVLGENGNKHPIATWGNGITTNPSYYPMLLGAVASHGFVVIASNSANVTAGLMTEGLDWMIAQNNAAGEYQGKLNTTCLITFGYSLGGGASVGSGAHENVVATASMHGVTGAANLLHAPLLLLTAETDTFVTPAVFVTPTYGLSTVQTFYGTLSRAGDPTNLGHLIPVDGGLSLITPPEANIAERAAVIAWLRLWAYNDEGAKRYFYGNDCVLCGPPWTNPQRKNWP